MKKIIAITIAVACMAGYRANASVNIIINSGDLTLISGLVDTAHNGLGLLVADTGNLALSSNFGSLSPTSPLSLGANLISVTGSNMGTIIARNDMFVGSGQHGIFVGDTGNLPIGGAIQPGVSVFELWFPMLSGASTQPGGGTQYGAFRPTAGVSLDGGDLWVIPPDGNAFQLSAISTSEGGLTPDSSLRAQFTTIPEPSTMALVGIGLLGMLGFARRRS